MSQPEPLSATLPAAIMETVLTHLACLFLTAAAGNVTAARQAATRMLAAYHPRTPAELSLAASIVGFNFHALEALAQASAPDTPVTRVLRLRGSAVSMSREAAKAERRLAQLRNPAKQPRPQPAPSPETAAAPPVKPIGKPIAALAKAKGISWTRANQERQRDLRIAANVKKAEARVAAFHAANPPPQPQAV